MLHNLEQHEAPNDFFLLKTKCFILPKTVRSLRTNVNTCTVESAGEF